MAYHAIYIPGLGDKRPYGQNIAIQLWRFFGITPHYFPLGWNKPEGYSTKQNRLIQKIETLSKNGDVVSLVGVSAGASAALNAYAQSNKISKTILISGKINNADTISPKFFLENPDFKQSMQLVKVSLQKLPLNKVSNIMSTHPWRDQTVPILDTIVDGAKEKTLPGWSHATGIFFGAIFGAASISRFIRATPNTTNVR